MQEGIAGRQEIRDTRKTYHGGTEARRIAENEVRIRSHFGCLATLASDLFVPESGFSPRLSASAVKMHLRRSGCGPAVEEPENVAQALAQQLEFGEAGFRLDQEGKRRLLLFAFSLELGACAGDGEPFVVEQLLNADYVLHVRATIGALPGAALGRLELGKLGFPEAQYVRWQTAKAADFADAKVELVGNQDFARSFARGILRKFWHALLHGRKAAVRILSRLREERQSKFERSGGLAQIFLQEERNYGN